MHSQLDELSLIQQAKDVLNLNDKGDYISPSIKYYRHQWLWDTAFIAIGLARYDAKRASSELLTLKRGQWRNGMLPHVIFANRFHDLLKGPLFWQWHKSKLSSKGIVTSAITQPPMIAIATHIVAQKLPENDRQTFLRNILPMIIKYHEWMYRERNPDGTGLIVTIHPWETGLDNNPAWAELLDKMPRPWWVRFLDRSGVFEILMRQRRGARSLHSDERTSSLEIIQSSRLILRYRKHHYENNEIFQDNPVATQSVAFNSILIKANASLVELAKMLGEKLSKDLMNNFHSTEKALDLLWDEENLQYFSRDYTSKELIKAPSITTFFPLYTGIISNDRAKALVSLLKDNTKYWTEFPVPSVPLDSPYFNQKRFWQGPAWMNTNWLLINGLKIYGYTQEASEIVRSTKTLAYKSGFSEYYSPLNGDGLGVKNFSWSAALYIDIASEI